MLSRIDMIEIFQRGVEAADPARAVTDAMPALEGTVQIISIGKAACAMARAARAALPAATPALVVTNYENAAPVDGATVLAAGHPVPDENGLRAAQAVEAALHSPFDHVLVLVSGGGSALLPAPVAGLSLADKAHVNRLLLGAGLDIVAMNATRQHLSRFKGGGLLRLAAPARVSALILSDVVGDDLRAIASGPTVAPIMARADVVEMLRANALWDALPSAARTALLRPEHRTPLPEARNLLIGSNAKSVAAMATACTGAQIMDTPLTGDVAQACARIIALPRGVTLMGGETTVQITGQGRGGRNQELALRVAIALQGQPDWRFLSAGTDGRDGPTDAAGAVVDGNTVARIRAKGGDPDALLRENDSYRALELAGDLLITGATGTNVADLQIFARS